MEHRQRHRHAQAVIGTERRPFGFQPVAVHPGLDRVFLEIVLDIGVLLRHHIHMALQNDSPFVLAARMRRLADNDVSALFTNRLQTEFAPKIIEVGAHLLFVFGRTGNTGQLIEILPNGTGFEILYSHSNFL